MSFVLSSFEITMLHMCLDVFLVMLFLVLCLVTLGALIGIGKVGK